MLGDGGDGFAAGASGQGDGEGVVVDCGRPSAAASLGGCGREAVEGAFVDELAFHGGDHEQHLVGDGLPDQRL
jgi:hypothetical protein